MKGVQKCILCYLILGDGGPIIKVAQNGLKHILVLEFLKSYEILKISIVFITIHTQPDSDQLSRSALKTG